MITFKWLTVPTSNETKEVNAVQLWEVRWHSRHGEYHSDTRPEVEAFITKELAEEFATSLRNAYKLLRHTNGTGVSMKEVG
jgi:hypothetical protein